MICQFALCFRTLRGSEIPEKASAKVKRGYKDGRRWLRVGTDNID